MSRPGRTRFLVSLAVVALAVPSRNSSRAQDPKPPQPELVASTGPRTPAEERQGFHLPPGFDMELVACEPDIHKPMNLAFDDLGRLWVTSSLEYPFPAREGTVPRDTVKILEDFGPDGRARKVTTFAEGLNIPIGVLPLTPREALVHSIPKVWRLIDDDGDGKADRREPAYQTYGSNDTHGMTNAFTWGFDGWIYACHGFANSSSVRGADGHELALQSGNTYRMRPDGSRVEWHTHGQVNPFGLSFDPIGNLYSCDCHTRPIFQLLRGAYYDSFGKPHDGLGYGPEMMQHDHGSTGIAGITYYAADHFPEEWRGTIFIGNVVTSRINHDRLERHGSTEKAIVQPDFLVSDDPWFRPVDIELGPDGALYVADFYNKIIGHYEVPLTHPGRDRERGRIWRIVYRGSDDKGSPKAARTDWTSASVEELVKDLEHPNLSVRMRSTNQLVARGGDEPIRAVARAMARSGRPETRMHGIWVLERRGALKPETLARCAADPSDGVRVHAMRVLGERSELSGEERTLTLKGLKDEDAFVRRAAAEALGRHPSSENLRPLLALRHAVPADDTHLLHVVRMALRDQFGPADVMKVIEATDWDEPDARALADVAVGAPSPDAARFLLAHVRRWPEPDGNLERYVHHIARYGDKSADLIAFVTRDRPDDLAHQARLLKAIQQGTQERGASPDAELRDWAGELVRKLIGSKDSGLLGSGLELAGSLKLSELNEDLLAMAESRATTEDSRTAALKALVAIDPKAVLGTLGRILGDAAEPLALRQNVADLLALTNQGPAQDRLLEVLPVAPGALQTRIAVSLTGTRPGAERFLEAIRAGRASARLLQERPIEVRLKGAGVPDLDARLAELLAGLPPADAQLLALLKHRREGYAAAKPDLAQGERVFEKNCAICHRLNNRGEKIGPQLDGVGVRGPDRLMEDILDPNRNIDQAFRQTTILRNDGQVVSGLLLREEGEILVLADTQGKEVRVPKSDVEERHLAPVSPMPAGLADQIAEEDFYHLIGYLVERARPEGTR